MKIVVRVRRSDVRFSWPCGCWVSFKKPLDREVLLPPVYEICEEDYFDPWAIVSPLGLDWMEEFACALSAHGGGGTCGEHRQYRTKDAGYARWQPSEADAILFSAGFAAYARHEVAAFSVQDDDRE